jgi:membrane protein
VGTESRNWLQRARGVLGFLNDVRKHFDEDAGALLAAGLAFNGLLNMVPALLLLTSVAAVFVSKDVDVYQKIIDYIHLVMPGISEQVLKVLFDLVRNKEVLGAIGLLGLFWTSIRIFGSVRAALSRILRTRRGRPFFHGKLLDLVMVCVVGLMLLLSIILTSVLEAIEDYSAQRLNLHGQAAPTAHLPQSGALVMSAFLFFVLFRYVPAERVRVGSAALGAIVSAVLWEVTKLGLTTYLKRVDDISAIYGSLGLFVVLALWAYYSAIAFVVGAEFAAVREERLAARDSS